MDIFTMPMQFGKYKGRSLNDVFAEDRGYIEWLTQQPNMQKQHAQLFAAAISLLVGPQKTPEHNKLQARFMNPNFLRRVIARATRTAWSGKIATVGGNAFVDEHVKVKFEHEDWDAYVQMPCTANIERIDAAEDAAEDAEAARVAAEAAHNTARAALSTARDKARAARESKERDRVESPARKGFQDIADRAVAAKDYVERDRALSAVRQCNEHYNKLADVAAKEALPDDVEEAMKSAISATDGVKDKAYSASYDARHARDKLLSPVAIAVEAKPTIGDDYASVLRQIENRWRVMASRRKVGYHQAEMPDWGYLLLVGAFHSTVLDRDGLRRFFASSNISVWFVDELDALQDVIPPPPWLQA